MRIVSASLSGFRNLKETTLEFSPCVNLVLGRNGEGKTNLLEALHYFSLGRSHRGCRNDELIAFGTDALHVTLEVQDDSAEVFTCDYGLSRDGERRFRLDHEPIGRRVDLVGRLAAVFFNPDTAQLVRGGPQYRRQYLDQSRAEVEPAHIGRLLAFQRALRQKTGLLRELKRGPVDWSETRRELRAWNRELAECAAGVCLGRHEQAALLGPLVQENHNALLDNEIKIDILYRPRLKAVRAIPPSAAGGTPEIGDLAEEIFREIDYIGELEIRRARPLVGPQFDDLEVRLGGVDLRVFGSQGETRTAAVALTLARSDALFQKRRVRPVMFFDDIFSELDGPRSRRLQDLSSRLHQVFVATARSEDTAGWLPEQVKIWRVAAGTVTGPG